MVRPWRETHRHGSNCALEIEWEMMTRRALAGSTRSTRATPASFLTGTDVGRKMAGGHIVRRCSTDEATTKVEV